MFFWFHCVVFRILLPVSSVLLTWKMTNEKDGIALETKNQLCYFPVNLIKRSLPWLLPIARLLRAWKWHFFHFLDLNMIKMDKDPIKETKNWMQKMILKKSRKREVWYRQLLFHKWMMHNRLIWSANTNYSASSSNIIFQHLYLRETFLSTAVENSLISFLDYLKKTTGRSTYKTSLPFF